MRKLRLREIKKLLSIYQLTPMLGKYVTDFLLNIADLVCIFISVNSTIKNDKSIIHMDKEKSRADGR